MLPAVLAFGLGLSTAACTSNASSPSSASEARAADNDAPPAESAETEPEAESVPPAEPAAPVKTDEPRSVAQRVSDASVAARVRQALVRESSLRVFDFNAEAVRGRVILRGDVNTRKQHERVEQVAARVDGVRSVDNRVTVSGRSIAELDGDGASGDGDEAASQATYHVVQAGESLWTIARRYNASIRRIKELNNLRSDGIRPGQRIRIR